MVHKQEPGRAVDATMIDGLEEFFSGLENLVVRAERIVDAVHALAQTVETMEVDGSLYTLLDILEKIPKNSD